MKPSFVETRGAGLQWVKIHRDCFGQDAYDPSAYTALIREPDQQGRVRHFELREGRRCLGYAVLEVKQATAQSNDNVEVVVLSYLGVDGEHQGRGIGTSMMRELIALCSAQYPNAAWLVLEIDDRREQELLATELRRRERLAQFYLQFKARFWNGKHLRPSFLNKRMTFAQELCFIPLREETGDPSDSFMRTALDFILIWGYELTRRSATYRRVIKEQFAD